MLDGLSENSSVGGSIARAAEQFEEALSLAHTQAAPRLRLNRAITVIDSIIGRLERHNLKGTVPAPEALESGVSEALRATAQLGISIGRGRSLKKVIDDLFTVQQRLMAMRAGPGWEWAYADEEGKPTGRRISHAGD